MKKTLALREYITCPDINFSGAMKGPWVFQRLDDAAVIWIIDNIVSRQKDITALTIDTEIKFKKPIYRYGYAEVHVGVEICTCTRVKLHADLYYCGKEYPEKILAATSILTFAFVDRENKQISLVRKDIVEEINNQL